MNSSKPFTSQRPFSVPRIVCIDNLHLKKLRCSTIKRRNEGRRYKRQMRVHKLQVVSNFSKQIEPFFMAIELLAVTFAYITRPTEYLTVRKRQIRTAQPESSPPLPKAGPKPCPPNPSLPLRLHRRVVVREQRDGLVERLKVKRVLRKREHRCSLCHPDLPLLRRLEL